jgi:hypothetical protein
MPMPPRLRRRSLATHVASSVGWLGSVVTLLALAIAGLASADEQLVRSAYIAMELIGWYVLVPFSLVSLLSGLTHALGTTWGLFRHYWVLFKLVMSVVATTLLLLHMQVAGHVATAAAGTDWAGSEVGGMRIQLGADSAAAVIILLIALTLSIYKPRGLTSYGWRKQQS